MQKKCQNCGKAFSKRVKETLTRWEARRFCSDACRLAGLKDEGWSEERVEELKKLWADGVSAGVIGQRWGITRSAVIGKVHRLGLPGRITTRSQRNSKKLHLPIRPSWFVTFSGLRHGDPVKQLRRLSADMREVKPIQLPVVPKAFEEREASRGVALLELDLNGCRFPVNKAAKDEQHLFCNAPQMPGSSYCEACHSKCYVKPHRSTKRFVMNVRRAA